jgi:hypothetical protein
MVVFSEKLLISRIFLSAILVVPRVGEEVDGAVLSAPESLLVSSSTYWLMGGRSWIVSSAMECRVGVMQRAVEKNSRRLEAKSEKRWD